MVGDARIGQRVEIQVDNIVERADRGLDHVAHGFVVLDGKTSK